MDDIKMRSFWDGDCYIYQVLINGNVVLSAYTFEECEQFVEKLEKEDV